MRDKHGREYTKVETGYGDINLYPNPFLEKGRIVMMGTPTFGDPFRGLKENPHRYGTIKLDDKESNPYLNPDAVVELTVNMYPSINTFGDFDTDKEVTTEGLVSYIQRHSWDEMWQDKLKQHANDCEKGILFGTDTMKGYPDSIIKDIKDEQRRINKETQERISIMQKAQPDMDFGLQMMQLDRNPYLEYGETTMSAEDEEMWERMTGLADKFRGNTDKCWDPKPKEFITQFVDVRDLAEYETIGAFTEIKDDLFRVDKPIDVFNVGEVWKVIGHEEDDETEYEQLVRVGQSYVEGSGVKDPTVEKWEKEDWWDNFNKLHRGTDG